MNILGISAFYHDSAATIVQNGQILAAAQEERFTRKKHDANFPSEAIKFCLEYNQLNISDLDIIAFYDKPLLKFERLLETYYAFAPRGLNSFLQAMPIWLGEKLFSKKIIRDELKKIAGDSIKKIKILFPEHHLSHAASAFYPSSFEQATILTLDGVGEWATTSISLGEGKNIKVLQELHFPHSLGLLYSAFTYFLGFKVNSGEYKLMGLAPYGNSQSTDYQFFIKKIHDCLVDIKSDGSIWLNQKYFTYSVGLRMVNDHLWAKLFGLSRRLPEQEITQKHCDLALAIQNITEEIVLKIAKTAQKLTQSENLCLAGGVALNCVANGKLQNSGIFKNIFIQPASGDAGGAIGAALAAYHIHFQQDRIMKSRPYNTYLGNEFSDFDIEQILKKYKTVYQKVEKFADLCQKTAQLLVEGKVIGWFQGRMEFGPRALGNRSILADARNPEMQKKLNLKIKFRESFRPFAPAVLAEDAAEYFEMKSDSPYMLLVQKVREKYRKSLPENYAEWDLKEKLYTQRSDLQSITHVDFSARIQTVHQETNPKFWELLQYFKKITGCSVLVNTSFNVRGEPIVCTPEDAYRCFRRTEMDYLVIGNFILAQSEQTNWQEKDDWQTEFTLD